MATNERMEKGMSTDNNEKPRIITVGEQLDLERGRHEMLMQIHAVDLAYALERTKKIKYETEYWKAMATHPGKHDALFNKVLKEVQSVKLLLEKVLTNDNR